MKPTKSFAVEIKRNGRRTVKTVEKSIWEPHVLQSATNAVQKSSEPDPDDAEIVDAGRNPKG